MSKQQPANEVYCPYCKDKVDVKDVVVIDVAEDDRGADLVTFVCNHCGETSQSNVFMRR